MQSYSPRLEPRRLPEREPEPPTEPRPLPAVRPLPESSDRSDRLWSFVGPVLRVCAEAGFFAVLYATLSVTLEGSAPLLGPTEFILLVAAGALIGTYAQNRPELGAPVLVVAVVGAGLASWLADPVARELLNDNHLGAAMLTHGIGWLGAFAVLRGSFIRGTSGGATQLETLLRGFLPAIALMWAVATVFAPKELVPTFIAYALWGSLVLIVAGLAGIGLVRVRELHAGVSESRVRRLWRWLVLAAAISVVPLSMPFVVLAGVPVDVLFKPLAGPALFIIGIVILPFGLLIDVLVMLLTPIASNLAKFLDELRDRMFTNRRPDLGQVEPSLVTTLIGLALAGVVIFVLVAGAYSLARWLLSRKEETERLLDIAEGTIEHDFEVPAPDPPQTRGTTRHRRVAAHDAVTAYVNAVEDLASHPPFARAVVETPAEHSLRLRAADMPGSPEFSRLAADYQLARYAERPITPREDRRALSRLDRLRRALRGN